MNCKKLIQQINVNFINTYPFLNYNVKRSNMRDTEYPKEQGQKEKTTECNPNQLKISLYETKEREIKTHRLYS